MYIGTITIIYSKTNWYFEWVDLFSNVISIMPNGPDSNIRNTSWDVVPLYPVTKFSFSSFKDVLMDIVLLISFISMAVTDILWFCWKMGPLVDRFLGECYDDVASVPRLCFSTSKQSLQSMHVASYRKKSCVSSTQPYLKKL